MHDYSQRVELDYSQRLELSNLADDLLDRGTCVQDWDEAAVIARMRELLDMIALSRKR